MKKITEIDQMIAEAEKELAQLEARRSSVLETIKKLIHYCYHEGSTGLPVWEL